MKCIGLANFLGFEIKEQGPGKVTTAITPYEKIRYINFFLSLFLKAHLLKKKQFSVVVGTGGKDKLLS